MVILNCEKYHSMSVRMMGQNLKVAVSAGHIPLGRTASLLIRTWPPSQGA